ncbi:MAG TPA: S9 family peptidase [Gammaproteobacteria bacterium]|nr:S9 family peptidase [Gammaproteobacteria bacterium]
MEKKLIQFSLLTFIVFLFTEIALSDDQIPTEVFGSPPLIGSVKISPSGEKIAMFATLNNGDSAILIRDLTKNEPLKPIASSDNKSLKLLSFNWFDDEIILASAWLAQDVFNTKADYTRLLRVNVDGSGFTPLFKKRHFKDLPLRWEEFNQTRIIDWLPDDDENILVMLRMSNARSPDVVKLNVKKNSIKTVKKGVAGVGSWMTDEDGRVRIGNTYDRNRSAGSIIFQEEGSTKWRTIWDYSSFGEDSVSVLGFGKEPNKVWYEAYKDGRIAVFSADISKQNIEPELVYSHPKRDVETYLRYRKDKKDPIGIGFRDENFHHVTWDKEAADFEKSIYALFPDKEVYFGGTSDDRNRYIIFVENSSTAGSFYLGDKKLGTLDLVAHSYPALANKVLPTKKALFYKARDGLDIEAFLTLPEGKNKKLPTIIFPHGGPIAADGEKGFDYWTSFFANRGYAVVQMNFRGSTGYGYDFMKAGLGQWGGQMQEDVEDATYWAIKEGIADPDRICIVGGSYGGYAALMGAATSDLYQCSVSFAGVSDLLYLLDGGRRYGGEESIRIMLGDKSRSELREISPVYLADQIKIPVLLVQGDDDSRVLLKHGEAMRDAMEEAGVDYLYIQQEDSDHFLTLKRNRLQFFEETEKFLKKHIGN